jgi:hypothetical protein
LLAGAVTYGIALRLVTHYRRQLDQAASEDGA